MHAHLVVLEFRGLESNLTPGEVDHATTILPPDPALTAVDPRESPGVPQMSNVSSVDGAAASGGLGQKGGVEGPVSGGALSEEQAYSNVRNRPRRR